VHHIEGILSQPGRQPTAEGWAFEAQTHVGLTGEDQVAQTAGEVADGLVHGLNTPAGRGQRWRRLSILPWSQEGKQAHPVAGS
jgi:hypothetical protein